MSLTLGTQSLDLLTLIEAYVLWEAKRYMGQRPYLLSSPSPAMQRHPYLL